MQRAYVFNDEKSHKFWWCETLDHELLVNHGKFGSAGKYQIKQFDTVEATSAAADKLVRQKLAKGYAEAPDFDFIDHFYFDDEEYGLHRLTSHPHFRTAFADDLYYDCGDEEAPFTLHALRRIAATTRVLEWGEESEINRQMLADWQGFGHVDG